LFQTSGDRKDGSKGDIMQTDYLDAFVRHLRDARLLFDGAWWANADQLYGYSAECGLKCLMQAFGMSLEPGGSGKPGERADRVHADKIWDRYQVYRTGYGFAKYVLPRQNPFYDWSIDNRYAGESNFDMAYVEPHKDGAEAVEAVIAQAKEDGLI
jgi:hypothetical protein